MTEITKAPGAAGAPVAPGTVPVALDAEDKISVAGQWTLMWWRFRKHKLALGAVVVVALFYLVVVFADFFAYADPDHSDAQRALIPPQPIHLIDNGRFSPFVYGLTGTRNLRTFQRVYTVDPNVKIPVRFFAPGREYRLLGVIPTDIHLVGTQGQDASSALALLGTDNQGRDMWSRLMFATRLSLTIGLTAVALSLVLGVIIGGISGYYGGALDTLIQRVIEILRSIPTIPLWMGLAAAVPRNWSVEQVYFAITLIISLIGWTELARVVRGRFLSLREEDFVTAAELIGCSRMRVVLVHLVPLFLSYIIAATTLALPNMILSETSLSFLGLGLRPPAISWGVLLSGAQNVQTLALSPWLLVPAAPVVLVILAFNFMGDGLRDAADPYN